MIEIEIKGASKYLETLSKEEREEYVKHCFDLYKNKVLSHEIDRVIEDTVYAMAEEWHGAEYHYFGKGIINGLQKFRENLGLLHGEFIQQVKDAESKETEVPNITLEDLP